MTSKEEFDKRYIGLKRGLNQLNVRQIKRIIDFHESGRQILCDNYNYDKENGLWCPLAIGLNVHKSVSLINQQLTDEVAKEIIIKEGKKYDPLFSLNPLKGVEGDFFRENRQEDLIVLCKKIIEERTVLKLS